MEGESCESDASESWSLIDINMNEESVLTSERTQQSDMASTDVKNVKLKRQNSIDIEESSKVHRKENRSKSKGSLPEEPSDKKMGNKEEWISDDGSKNDSGDAESIEVLDAEESEIDDCELSVVDDSNDTDVSEVDGYSYSEEVEKSYPFVRVVKRKERKLGKNSETSINSVYSEIKFPLGKYSVKKSKERTVSGDATTRAKFKICKKLVDSAMNGVFISLILGVAFMTVIHIFSDMKAEFTAKEILESLKELEDDHFKLEARITHLNKELYEQNLRNTEIPDLMNMKGDSTRPNSRQELKLGAFPVEVYFKIQEYLTISDPVKRSKVIPEIGRVVRRIKEEMKKLMIKSSEAVVMENLDYMKSTKALEEILRKLLISHENLEKMYEEFGALKKKSDKKRDKTLSRSLNEKNSGTEEKSKHVEENIPHAGDWEENSVREKREIPKLLKNLEVDGYSQTEKNHQGSDSIEEATVSIDTGEKMERDPLETWKPKPKAEGESRKKVDNDKMKKNESQKLRPKKRDKKEEKKDKKGKMKKKMDKIYKDDPPFVAKLTPAELREYREFQRMDAEERKKMEERRRIEELRKMEEEEDRRKKAREEEDGYFILRVDASKWDDNICKGKSRAECANATRNWFLQWGDGREEYRRYKMREKAKERALKQRLGKHDDDDDEDDDDNEEDEWNWQLKRGWARQNEKQDRRSKKMNRRPKEEEEEEEELEEFRVLA